MIKRLLIILMLIMTESHFMNAQFYYTRHGDIGDEEARFIMQTMNKGYLIVGNTNSFGSLQNDVYVVRTESTVTSGVQKNYGGWLADLGMAAIELADSSVVVVGYSNSFGPGYDIYLFKIDKLGKLIWQKTYGGNDWDFGYSICKSSDGNLIVCGTTYSYGSGDKQGIVLKLDTSGNLINQKIYGGLKDDEFNKVITTNDGSLMLVGTTRSYGDPSGDMWLAKLSVNLDSINFYFRGSINKRETGRSIVQDVNNNYLVVGGSETLSNGKMDMYLLKLKTDLTVDWERNYGLSDKDEEAFDIKTANSNYGNMIVCYTTEEISGFKKDAKALLLSGLGYYIDGGRIGSGEDDEVFSISNSTDKGYALAGYTNGFNSAGKDAFVIKFDSLVNGSGTLVLSSTERKTKELDLNYRIQENPFSDLIRITQTQSDASFSCRLFAADGVELIHETSSLSGEITLHTQHLKSGFYNLLIESNRIRISYKLICIN